jgi:hypothetical protein
MPKGFALMNPEQRRAASRKGAATRRAKAEERKRAEDECRRHVETDPLAPAVSAGGPNAYRF